MSKASWPPNKLALPDNLADIESGRPQPPRAQRDESREGRLKRLLGIPGVRCASDFDIPPADGVQPVQGVLFDYKPCPWELE